MTNSVEYRVRPVTRFIVTRYHSNAHCGGVDQRGEFDNERVAYEVAYALCRAEHAAAGTALDDPGFRYPQPLDVPEPARLAEG